MSFRSVLLGFLPQLVALFKGGHARQATLSLAVEVLETRETPAGMISVTANGGLLSITGDGLANQVQVSRAGQTVTVTGNNGTRVVGPATASNITQLAVDLGANDDMLSFSNSGAKAMTKLTVKGGDGYDDITLSGVQIEGTADISLGPSDDKLYFTGVAKVMNIDGGAGNNNITVQLGTGTVDALVVDSAARADSGRDSVSIRGSGASTRVNSTVVRSGSQNDVVSIAYLSASRVYAHGGRGTDDHISLSGISLYGDRRIDIDAFERVN